MTLAPMLVTLIISNFHLQLWWYFFQISVNGDVVYAQTWEVLTPKNPINGATLTVKTFKCIV